MKFRLASASEKAGPSDDPEIEPDYADLLEDTGGFLHWLRAQAGRWDMAGHLAMQSLRDAGWPRTGSLSDFHKHLREINAGKIAHEALNGAYSEYLSDLRDRSEACSSAERRTLPLRECLGLPSESHWDNGAFADFHCPVCWHDYVHFETPAFIPGEDNYKAGWSGRGDLIAIPMWCEQGHAFEICLGSHKGETVIFIRNARSAPPPPGEDGPPPSFAGEAGGARA